jgi:hypothetical protein
MIRTLRASISCVNANPREVPQIEDGLAKMKLAAAASLYF